MTAFNRIHDNLRIKLPGATDLAIMLELFNTVENACRMGDIYMEQVQVPVVAGVYTYAVPSPPGVAAVPSAVFTLAHPTYPPGQTTYDPETRQITLIAPVTPEHVGLPITITAKFVPNAAYSALDPASVAAVLPAYLWERHYQMFIDGTLARMFAQVAKPYSNREMAVMHMRLFRAALSRAKSEQVKGHMPGGQAWLFPAFA